MTTTKLTYEDLATAAGRDLGASRWIHIAQNRIDGFADVTEDHQWIHVDPERAASGTFGTTIAHGYLTISLVGALLGELLAVEPDVVLVNYGLDKLRFTAPVPVGSRLRARAEIAEVIPSSRGLQLTLRVIGEVEGAEKPSCVADARVLVSR
ncbi:MaoC family dehydratase [Rhodococcus koreensis]|uniref:MaoC family dehydratase n=1 Tax=Rhodococcus koreensis TaxID=99653 RepID=UPI00366F80E4